MISVAGVFEQNSLKVSVHISYFLFYEQYCFVFCLVALFLPFFFHRKISVPNFINRKHRNQETIIAQSEQKKRKQ